MTLFEFQQKLPTVSDRRLVRMLEKAQQSGLEPAVDLIQAEQSRRKADGKITVFLSPSLPPATPPNPPPQAKTAHEPPSLMDESDDLTSQIRPLEEVLGRNFGWKAGTSKKTNSEPPLDFSALQSEMNDEIPFEFSGREGQSDAEPEEMAPITLTQDDWKTAPEWQTLQPTEIPRLHRIEKPAKPTESHPQRTLILVAIILLFIAGCLAIWRALVG